MVTLPMLAFRLTGIDEFIELTIDEIWGFPNDTTFKGGYDAKCTLAIRAAGYSVSDMLHSSTGELYRFMTALKRCHEDFSGSAILEDFEGALDLKCEFNKFGHVIISGKFRARPSVDNVLYFTLKTDQTQASAAIADLEAVYKVFGGNQGKKEGF